MYDVIVVGAGPTGSAAARLLAERGHKVLVAERFPMPRYKSCSGILIKKSMDLVQQYFGEEIPEFVTCLPAENKGMVFTDDRGQEFVFAQEGRNVWRSSFDKWLADRAAEKGAEIRPDTAVLSCEEKEGHLEVSLKGETAYTEQAKYVLDCEGVTGSLKRKLTKTKPQYITTFQAFHRGSIDLDSHYFYAYLQPELSEYDAWFNVKDNLLVLGVAVKDTAKIEFYYKRFLAYMKKQHRLQIDAQEKAEKWLMPRIRPGCPVDYGVGRVLFAGEIAGFLNPMGEGISCGMESGHCAACAISEHMDDVEKVYASYRDQTKLLKTYMERQWSLVGRMADTFREFIIK